MENCRYVLSNGPSLITPETVSLSDPLTLGVRATWRVAERETAEQSVANALRIEEGRVAEKRSDQRSIWSGMLLGLSPKRFPRLFLVVNPAHDWGVDPNGAFARFVLLVSGWKGREFNLPIPYGRMNGSTPPSHSAGERPASHASIGSKTSDLAGVVLPTHLKSTARRNASGW